jgi:tetratricopeptide (TPR) repeat protein
MQHLQDRTRRQITKAVETPEREMKTAIFRRGMEKLVTEMKKVGFRKTINDFLKKVGFYPILKQRRLYDTLQIDTLKQELEAVRQTGDIARISAKELEIAKKIQKEVSSFPYKNADGGSYHPSKMVETQFINCVGSSILGGGLLDEVGIKYLHADLPQHSATVLITSDGKVYWQDFAPGNLRGNYTEISPDMIEEKVDLLNVLESGTTLHFKEWNPYRHVNGNLRANLFRPEVGLQSHILNNTGYALINLSRNEEAVEAYQQAINVDPKYATPYNGLGNALRNLGRNEEAVEAYQQAINVDPKDAAPYNGLGNALRNLDRNEEAVKAYQQAINVDPKYATPYNGLGNALINLSRNEEAVEAYQQFIKLWNGDEYWTNRAKKIIENLQK